MMSNVGTDNLIERIIDEVDTIWVLKDRDDLKTDCIKYVYNYYKTENIQLEVGIYLLDQFVKDLVIEFLSMKCADALSTADLDSMARAEEESRVSSYQEADQGL